MPLKNQKPCLAVLDVGHGSAAVLRDEGGVVVFDAGCGAHIDHHLKLLVSFPDGWNLYEIKD